MRIPAPADLADKIAQRALVYARQDVQGRGWTSANALMPVSAPGQVGLRSTVKYLLIQNRGFGPFIMWWVEGRTIPMACKQGDGPHTRRGKDPGKPGYVNIPHVGRVWRDQKWKHPGLKPKRFMESAITKAIKESKADLQSTLMTTISGGEK